MGKDWRPTRSEQQWNHRVCRTKNLWLSNFRHVTFNIYSVDRVTWHDGAIPADEVWLKLGGDKGGGTFKMWFQNLNVETPNAPDNTCVFSIFEASDTYTNLSIALLHHKEETAVSKPVCALLKAWIHNHWTSFRGKKVRLFLCGDYEFLCRIYGLSGPNGRFTVYIINLLCQDVTVVCGATSIKTTLSNHFLIQPKPKGFVIRWRLELLSQSAMTMHGSLLLEHN